MKEVVTAFAICVAASTASLAAVAHAPMSPATVVAVSDLGQTP